MSPNRFQAGTKLWVYRLLVLRDGEQCSRCFKKPTATNGDSQQWKLDIHHRDSDPYNNEPDNLELRCRGCNNKARSETSKSYSAKIERERKEGHASTRIIRQVINCDDPTAPITVRLNSRFENPARAWCLDIVAENGFYPKLSAITGMAELVGCSILTSSRFLSKLTGPLGPLQEVPDILGELMLTWKESHKPEPTIKLNLDTGEVVDAFAPPFPSRSTQPFPPTNERRV